MFRRVFRLTSIGVGGYFLGNGVEKLWREKYPYPTEKSRALVPKPGLPVFGTVSAATAIAPAERNYGDLIPTEPSAKAPRAAHIMRFGHPGLDNVRYLDDFVLSYDRRNRTAHWVFEHLTQEQFANGQNLDRSKFEFHEDTSIHPFFRSQNSDYKGSGFDRGHLAPAGNHKGDKEKYRQTFLLSNMAPQIGKGFNRNSWNQLEKHVRNLTKEYKNVYVCTGPLYLPTEEEGGKLYVKYQVIGANNVAVPTHFFKIVVMESDDGKTLDMESYVMPNEPIDDGTPLTSFYVAPDAVERAAGLLFFDTISRDKLTHINGKKEIWV